jgi:hypothetical protein
LDDLGGHDELARARLHRAKHARALEPKLGVRQIGRTGLTGLDGGSKLDSPLQDLFGSRCVPSAQEDFAEPPVNPRIARCPLSRRDKEVLRLGKQVRLDVHARDRNQHGDIAGVPMHCRAPHFVHEGLARMIAKGLAESDRGWGARVVPPALNELVDRVSH